MRRVARAAMSTARLLASRNALFIISLFAFAALAVPLHRRQTWTGRNSRELWEDGCKPIIFIFCRETIAPGNMVSRATCAKAAKLSFSATGLQGAGNHGRTGTVQLAEVVLWAGQCGDAGCRLSRAAHHQPLQRRWTGGWYQTDATASPSGHSPVSRLFCRCRGLQVCLPLAREGLLRSPSHVLSCAALSLSWGKYGRRDR